ncbi:MAG: hypothetical protein Q9201_006633 [Fulgogasparrea decipioides]
MPQKKPPQEWRDRQSKGFLHSPVGSSIDSIDEDDYVRLNENINEARWAGDQTKYIPPTPYESAKQSLKHFYKSNKTEPLTVENLQRHTVPLVRDLGSFCADSRKLASGYARRTLHEARYLTTNTKTKLVEAAPRRLPEGWTPMGRWPGAPASAGYDATTAIRGYRESREPEVEDLVIGKTSLKDHPTKQVQDTGEPNEPEQKTIRDFNSLQVLEDERIKWAFRDGGLTAQDKNTEEVRAFIQAAHERAPVKLGHKYQTLKDSSHDAKKGPYFFFDGGDHDCNPMGYSKTFKRPIHFQEQMDKIEKIKEAWNKTENRHCIDRKLNVDMKQMALTAARKAKFDQADDGFEDVPLEQPEDPDLLEELLPRAYPKTFKPFRPFK